MGLIQQISLDCWPYFGERSKNEACDLTLEVLDSHAHCVSVREFLNVVPSVEDRVLECFVGRGTTKCQAAILKLEA